MTAPSVCVIMGEAGLFRLTEKGRKHMDDAREKPKTVMMTLDVPVELVDNILSAALFGGIGYWTENVEFENTPLAQGGYGQITWINGNDRVKETLTRENLMNAFLWRYLDDECQNFDAEAGDVTVQLALFEEVKFG